MIINQKHYLLDVKTPTQTELKDKKKSEIIQSDCRTAVHADLTTFHLHLDFKTRILSTPFRWETKGLLEPVGFRTVSY